MPVQLGRPVRLYGGSFPFFVPGSPTLVHAFPGAASALVSWNAPTIDGGSPITNYVVTASPGGAQVTTAGGTVATVNGLTNGTAYTFTVKAYNLVGASPSSLPSAAVTPAAIPDAPTGVSAVPGNAQATVSWTASNSEGSPVTGYRVLSSPGGFTATTTGATSTTVTGLTNGTAYTFTVTATNSLGTSASSTASTAVTPTTLPGAPTSVVATPQDKQASVSWSAPASNGGSAITGYTITATPGGAQATTTGATTGIVTTLTDGTSYTFKVTATNANGTGPASAASAAVIPVASGGGGQPGPNSPGAPARPDGVWPMGYAGYVKGNLQALKILNRDWNFAIDGYDLSGWDIRGKVLWPTASGTGGVVGGYATVGGDGFIIRGAPGGTSANAFLDINASFTQNFPVFSNFTIHPTIPVKGTNGVMGSQATLFNFDIGYVGGDTLSPNNLDTITKTLPEGLPLDFFADWGYLHDCVYYLIDQVNGTHNDSLAEVPGGTNATFNRIRSTGIASPTLGDGVALRTVGPNDGSGPRLLGQVNSSFITTQNVSHVGNITVNNCWVGGGWYGTVNLQAAGPAGRAPLGPITITNNLFDGNDWGGNDLIIHSNVTGITYTGNTRVDGKPLKVLTGIPL